MTTRYTIEVYREPTKAADHLSDLADIESGPVASASIDVVNSEAVDLRVPGVYIMAVASAAMGPAEVAQVERLIQASHRVLEIARQENVAEAITLLEDRIATFERMLRDGVA